MPKARKKWSLYHIFTVKTYTRNPEIKTHYRNRLPHIAPMGARLFVTYRQDDSLPKHIHDDYKTLLQNSKLEVNRYKRILGKLDKLLDNEPQGSCLLKNPDIVNIVVDHLKSQDGVLYYLQAYTVMPNHVHILIDMSCQLEKKDSSRYVQLDKIMKNHKGITARLINQKIGKTGKNFWQKDNYDHFVRNHREWQNIVNYIIENPVKSGLVERWQDWPHTYVMPEILL